MFIVKRNQIIITALVVMIAVAGYLNYSDSKADNPGGGFAYSEGGDIVALVPDDSNLGRAVMVSAPTVSAPTVNSPVATTAEMAELTNANVISDNIGISLSVDEVTEKNINQESLGVTPTEGNSEAASGTTPAEAQAEQTAQPGEAMFVSATIDSTYFVQAKLDREQSRSKQKELLMEMINNQNLDQAKKADCADAMLDIQKRIEKESAAEAMIEAKGFQEVFVRIDDDTVDVVVSKEVLSDAEIAQIEDIIKRKTGIETANIRISPMNK